LVSRFVVTVLGAVVLGVGSFAGGAVATSGTALAASCGPGIRTCDHQDPEAMGCAGGNATTLDQAAVGSFVVQLRYSALCHAGWTRSTGGYTGRINMEIIRWRCAQFVGTDCIRFVQNASDSISAFSGGWTNMLDDTLFGLQACDTTHNDCTGIWHNGVLVG
jgi:hypothetical protein